MTKTLSFRVGRFSAYLTFTTRLAIRTSVPGIDPVYTPESWGIAAGFTTGRFGRVFGFNRRARSFKRF